MQKLINASPYAVISINEQLITTWNSAAEKIWAFLSAVPSAEPVRLLPLFDKQGRHQRGQDPGQDHLPQRRADLHRRRRLKVV
jgi:hypothetical protein